MSFRLVVGSPVAFSAEMLCDGKAMADFSVHELSSNKRAKSAYIGP